MIFLKEHFKIKIGVRRNLLHPLMLLVFIALRRIVQYLFKYYTDSMGPYLLPSLIFLSKFIFGLIAYLFLIYKSRSSNGIKYAGINLDFYLLNHNMNEYNLELKINYLKNHYITS